MRYRRAVTTTGTQRRQHDERGFTFSELALVVVVVVGLLIVATTSVRNIRRETASSNCQTELRTLKLATERYHAENQAYPVDKSVLIEGGLDASEVANFTVEFSSADTEPTYKAIPGPCD